MEASILSKVVLPASLFIVMLGMGLSMTFSDFRDSSKDVKTLSIGLAMQLLLLPIVAFCLVKIFGVSPILAVGVVVISLCPGGVTSNMYSYLAGGNLALSVSLTAIVSIVSPFTIPIVLGLSMNHFMDSSMVVTFPAVKMMVTLLQITILPVLIGMAIKNKFPKIADKAESYVKIFSLVLLAVIVMGIIKQNWEKLPSFFQEIGVVCFLLCFVTMGLSYGIAKLTRLQRRDRITIGLEVGIQNGTTGLFITSTLLNDPVMSIPAAVYSIIMFGAGAVYASYFARTKDSEAALASA